MGGMEKRDWTILLMRGFGLYLLSIALSSLCGLPGWLYLASSAFGRGDSLAAASLRDRVMTEVITLASRLLIFGGLGWWLFRSGHKAIAWLGPEPGGETGIP
jgi:hypothetical protein